MEKDEIRSTLLAKKIIIKTIAMIKDTNKLAVSETIEKDVLTYLRADGI